MFLKALSTPTVVEISRLRGLPADGDTAKSTPPPPQEVIADITKRMGAGMAEFIPKEVKTVDEYDKYCYYVAGLVGVGLSKLFAVSELESEDFMDLAEGQLSDSMGKFLQKTNIIRDYLEVRTI